MVKAIGTTVLTMSANTQPVSRYRQLRGKSVSESRAAIDHALGHDRLDRPKEPSPPLKSSLKRRSKSLGQICTSDLQLFTQQCSVPPVPPVPHLRRYQSTISRPTVTREPLVPVSGNEQQCEEPDRLLSPRAAPSPPIPNPAAMATAVTTDVAVRGDFDLERERWKLVDERWKAQERRVLSKEESDRLANILECETDRILAEQKKLDLARLHQQLVATQSTVSLSPPSLKPKSPVLEKFNFFNRARNSKAATLSPTSSTTASVDISRTHSLDPSLPPRAFIEQGGHGQLITPPMSPMSAHHFQERHVAVRCRGVTVNLTAVAESSPVDILFQASESITQHINTASSLVYECYTQLGLERRLRRYERICDVLNSWDHDAQNLLLIVPSGHSDGDKDLDISSVPTTLEPPPGFFLQLHHSSRPGKWSKRWITLLDDGQMISSKKGESSGDKSAQWLCHLSEYDIYTLMSKSASSTDAFGRQGAAGVTKNLKPPKKFVYALKLQQKTISSDSANFVHFFCTDDPSIANRFTARVHSWRSWYMVKSRREAQRKRLMEDAPQITPVKHKPRKSISHMKIPGQKHRIKLSVDETPYTIGDFQPLVEMERFEKPIDEFGKDWIPDPRLSALPPALKEDDAVTTEAPTTTQEELVVDVHENTPAIAQEPRSDQARPKTPATGTETEGGLQPLIDGIQAGVGIAVPLPAQPSTNIASPTERSPQEDLEPGPGPEAQVKSWLPSAVEHTARQKYEQQRLERLNNSNFSPTPKQQQRPSTSSGVAQSQRHHYGAPQPARGGLRQVATRVTAQSTLGDIARNYRAVSRWAETGTPSPTGGPGSGSPKFLEVPGARGNNMLPPLQRPSLPLPSSRPSTSGGERGRNHQYQLMQQQQQHQHQQKQYQQVLLQKQTRARSGSMSSMRRGGGGGAIGGPPVDPPPMPPLPPQMRALVREAQR
ncbi:hypothetical protein KVR01_006796 [Diaporthe batatas]|uniref:uncharacterized protein n=1 Tax=Diaporthe batatas TaxID=748121 RepID=UPI001D0512C5|nr:uncharacterized protein KVR01_006796 [Diaporthe batatas]KAG8163499.1 hypothetical protein KVR01_006796 [Diaporthe batatas]